MKNENIEHDESCLRLDPWGGWCDCGADTQATNAARPGAPSLLDRLRTRMRALAPRLAWSARRKPVPK